VTDDGQQQAPEPFRRLWRDLQERGFQRVSQEHGAMGGYLGLIEGKVDGANVRVELSGDRGSWSIAVAVKRGALFTPAAWRAYLDGEPMREPDPDRDAEVVAARLGEIVAAWDRRAGRSLRALGRRFKQERRSAARRE
jgi:hypothetical protein